MNFTQYIPSFKNDLPSVEQTYPQISYISIFNSQCTGTETDELLKQIIIHTNESHSSMEQLQIVGLIQGIQSLIHEFTKEDQCMKIKSDTSTILVQSLESHFFLICSLSSIDDLVLEQMSQLIKISNRRFTLFNKSLTELYQFDQRVLHDALLEHWTNFQTCFNSQYLKYPLNVNWTNSVNYKGFLGFFEYCKFSSIKLNNSQIDELKERVQELEIKPQGLIISYFNLGVSKKTGLVYKDSLGLSGSSLLDIYNWIEYNVYHEKNGSDFNTNLPPQEINRDIAGLNLINNLVVSPLNYTVSSVLNNEINWLSMPSFLKNLTMSEEPLDVEQEEDTGRYLVGLTDETITRRIVYIPSNTNMEEYQLVIFTREDFYITLVYPSSEMRLNEAQFYKSIQMELNLIIDDLISINLNESVNLSNSVNSLKSIVNQQEIDQDFFYIIFDTLSMSIQSSLPYLPYVQTNDDTNDKLRYQTAIYYLHDQLANLFQSTTNFQEFFHKFTTNKLNHWMFYYLTYKNKNIIIIKNKNKNQVNKSIPIEKSILDKLSSGYGNLGFIENLTDDIKYWLGNIN